MPLDNREMFARLIRCEAEGEGLDGMQAVATVIMNRVRVAYGEYFRVCQGNIRKVMTQPYQFTCLMTEVFNQINVQNVYNMSAEPIHYEVADWALSGNIQLGVGGEGLWYYNPFSIECAGYFPQNKSGVIYNRIGKHCFYNPTNLYAKT